MIDIIKQFDWNNHKLMNKERLYQEYMKLSSNNKNKVLDCLTISRKNLLNKMISKEEKNKPIPEIEFVLMPLHYFLSSADIKSYDEAALTFEIIRNRRYLEYNEKKESNYNLEEISFNNAKTEMIRLSKIMAKRNAQIEVNDKEKQEDREHLIQLLNNLEYTEVVTQSELIDKKFKPWEEAYISIGVPSSRAKKIVRGLKQFLIYVDNLGKEPLNQISPDGREYLSIIDSKATKGLKAGDNDDFLYSLLKISIWESSATEEFKMRALELYKVYAYKEGYLYNTLEMFGTTRKKYLEQERKLFSKYNLSLPTLIEEEINYFYDNTKGYIDN